MVDDFVVVCLRTMNRFISCFVLGLHVLSRVHTLRLLEKEQLSKLCQLGVTRQLI